MPDIATLRAALHADRLALQQAYLQRPRPARLLQRHSHLIDRHLRRIWQELALPPQLALVAVGGYGRGELYPHSDIDLLILLPGPADAAQETALQRLIGTLWDIGLEIGHSIRTVAECLHEAADITVETNLLDGRLVSGDPGLFQTLNRALRERLHPRAFYLAKALEQQQRHQRHADTDFNLEPNLKESPGGLRDLHTVLWIARACGLGKSWRELAAAGLLTMEEARAAARHEALLQTLRIRLHYLAGRREDRLLFDYQAALAEMLHIAPRGTRRASELLMQRYYRTRHAVQLLNGMLLQSIAARLLPESGVLHPINERFVARDDYLEARDEQLFEHTPAAILESFLLLARHPSLKGHSVRTLRALWRARRHIDATFRRNPHHRALFMDIVRAPQGLTHALRHMNQLDILGRYLPAFGRIRGQMQHDLFHVYTVDEHTLMVVRNLRRFTLAEHAHEFPLCSRLIRDFARPEVLYLAGLFHDIAKGRGGDHARLGALEARRFCRRHGLPHEDSELVAWLVEHHLLMSATAQKQDLSDPAVIAAFAAHVRNERHLVALYLLTVADIRGTSPKVWNAWKGKLLEDLLQATRLHLQGGQAADQVGAARRAAMETLNLYAIAPEVYQLLWAQLDAEYFLRHEAHEIAWHARMLAHRVNSSEPVVKARLAGMGEGIQVLVYLPNRPYLFVRVCDFFARLNYNIVEARIHTTQHGYALDSFLIMDAASGRGEYRDVMNYIEYELGRALTESRIPVAPGVGRPPRQLRHFPITPEVTLTPDGKGGWLLSVIAGDRPGLLARIAHVLAQQHVELHTAKINTLGARAEDSFWVSGERLDTPASAAQFVESLQKQLA